MTPKQERRKELEILFFCLGVLIGVFILVVLIELA